MEAGMLVQEWTVSEVWVSEHDGVRSTYAGELWGRLRLVNPTFGFEHGFLSGSCARLIHVSSRPRPGVRVLPTRPYPLERYPVVEAVGFRPCLDQHLDALLSGVRRLRPDANLALRQVGGRPRELPRGRLLAPFPSMDDSSSLRLDPPELDEPAVVYDAVDDRRREPFIGVSAGRL